MGSKKTFAEILHEEVKRSDQKTPCELCSHPDRQEIDRLLMDNDPERRVPRSVIVRALMKTGAYGQKKEGTVYERVLYHNKHHIKE